MEEDGVENLWAKTPYQATYFLSIFLYCHIVHVFFCSPSRVLMVMIASDPIPEMWEWIFFIPFPCLNFGNQFFHALPIPEFWEWLLLIPFPLPNFGNVFFPFPSRSRISGMESSIPVLVPERPKVIPAHPWEKTLV